MNTWHIRWRKVAPALTVILVVALAVGVTAIALYTVRQAAARPKAASVWQTLEARPLHLAQLASGQACVATLAQQSVSPDFSATTGAGPVYIVGGSANGVVTYIPPSLFNSGASANDPAALGGARVLWQIAPSYQGAALIRGGQLDGSNQLAFNGGLDQPEGNVLVTQPILPQLELMGGETNSSSWTTWVTLTRLAHPGCYAYQVDGVSFSYTITFQAVSEVG